MIHSMTGFAAQSGAQDGYSWAWELRSVNGKGLDLRLRVPDWLPGLEPALRKALGAAVARGNVTCNLRLTREEAGGGALQVNGAQLDAVLGALEEVEARAMARGVTLAPSKASDLLGLRGVLEHSSSEDDAEALAAALLADAAPLIAAFAEMRAAEGAALAQVLAGQLHEIETLTQDAAEAAAARAPEMAEALQRALARVVENSDAVAPERVAQELALIAVKADVTEEIDRLHAHVAAARAHLAEGGPVGRKLDFLMQEFNREANTLCSKAQNSALTNTGLALKAAIERMREQVQNVE